MITSNSDWKKFLPQHHSQIMRKSFGGKRLFNNWNSILSKSSPATSVLKMVFSLSLYKCWASKAALPSTAGADSMTTNNADAALVRNHWLYCSHYTNHIVWLFWAIMFRNLNSGMHFVQNTIGSHQNLAPPLVKVTWKLLGTEPLLSMPLISGIFSNAT